MPIHSFNNTDNHLLKYLPPYQPLTYKSYTPSITTASCEEFSLSSTATNTNNASSLVSSSAISRLSRTPNLNNQIGTDNFWFRRLRMNGQQLGANSSIPKMKSFWESTAEAERLEAEKCMQMHKLQRPYDFPKWRSSDAMTASLVASKQTPNLIPLDSRLPQHRINKIYENEEKAQMTKQLIQENATTRPSRRTKFNNSMCLAPEDFERQQQWYNADEIQSSIEKESIANMRATRDYFEQASKASDFENQLVPRPFTADRTVLSQVPLHQTLTVQCQQNYSPTTSPPSPIPQKFIDTQSVYSQPQIPLQNGNIHLQTIAPEINGRPMTFLEREILEVARREQDHKIQQQRLGHLTLEDTFELWRNGNDWNSAISRPNSSSGFHDFDNHDSGVENMTTSSINNN